MKGLINRNHGDGKYNIDLSSQFDYASSQDEIDRIDERIAAIDALIAAKTAEIEIIDANRVILRAAWSNLYAQQNFEWSIAYENETLNAMPEGEERDDLLERKEALEEWVEDNNIEEQLATQEAKIASMQEQLAGLEEGTPEWEALDGEIDAEMDYAIDIAEPIDQIEDIDRQLEAMPEGEERDALLEKIAFLQEQLDALKVDFEDLKPDLESLGLGVDLDGNSATIKRVIKEELERLKDEKEKLVNDILLLQVEKADLELKKERAEVRAEEQVEIMIYNVWCADLTEDLTGFIGILDVAGIPSLDTEVEDTDAEESEALDAEITELDAKIANMDAQMALLEEGSLEYKILELKKAAFELRKREIENDRKYKKKVPSDEVDPSEVNDGYNIQPGYEAGAVYNDVRDSVPMPDAYKYGIITAIDYDLDTCTVNLGSQVDGLT